MVLSRMHCAMPFSLLELQRLQAGARGVRGALMGCTLSTADSDYTPFVGSSSANTVSAQVQMSLTQRASQPSPLIAACPQLPHSSHIHPDICTLSAIAAPDNWWTIELRPV
jgi:hypothetical protein